MSARALIWCLFGQVLVGEERRGIHMFHLVLTNSIHRGMAISFELIVTGARDTPQLQANNSTVSLRKPPLQREMASLPYIRIFFHLGHRFFSLPKPPVSLIPRSLRFSVPFATIQPGQSHE